MRLSLIQTIASSELSSGFDHPHPTTKKKKKKSSAEAKPQPNYKNMSVCSIIE
jgi:hypothetical protein